MKNNLDITKNYYGKWWDVVDQEFPVYFDQQENPRDDQHQSDATKLAPQSTSQSKIQANMSFAQGSRAEQNAQHQRQSRDPRVRRQQDDEDDLEQLVHKGLSLEEAKTT